MSDEDSIRELHGKWIGLELEGRQAECAALCTGDIVIQPPIGLPITGRSAVKKFLSAAHDPLKSLETGNIQIEAGGDIAVKRARFRTRVAGVSNSIEGSHFWLLRRREGGWRIAYVAWSLDHAT